MNYEEIEIEFLNTLPYVLEEVYKLGGVDFEDLWNWTEDYINPSNGSVGGLILYSDTEPFAIDNFDEINELFDKVGIGGRMSFNDMTWRTWSIMMAYFMDFKEEYIENLKD